MEAQKPVVEALLKAQAYPEPAGKIELIQTHISYVFLTKNRVYKIKKAVNFGFLNFETLAKRRFFCEKELQLNRRLCDDMYLEVAPINRKGSEIKIKGEGDTIEYALVMQRMPQERIMTKLLEEGKVNKDLVGNIAKIIADFHLKAETNPYISRIGSYATVKANWDENFEQTRNVIGKTIAAKDYDLISKGIYAFLTQNKSLFEKRVAEGKVRDCHGDIHSGNIFITDRIYIFDAIEFNERFRYSDVAADMAFLAMELDFKNRVALSNSFVEKYIERSGDGEMLGLLPFYKCYRAYVRGKVVGFRLSDPNIAERQKGEATNEAKAYFRLAAKYSKNLQS